MVYKVYSGRVGGVLGDLITVEVDASSGLPGLDMIGLLGSEVKEARERVLVSLKNNGITIPAMRLTISLSPADERKSGAAFDLPIAVGLLGAIGYLKDFDPSDTLLIGELSLDGAVKPVKGILPIVQMAKAKGFRRVILPVANAKEGALIHNIDIIAVESLGEVLSYLTLSSEEYDSFIPPYSSDIVFDSSTDSEIDFSEVCGQESVKRAALIAAAGFHHLLMTGPPGTGKSLIAKRIPGIMPRLSYEECLEVTTIYSVSGKLSEDIPFIHSRPFWSPHHSASEHSLIGGGVSASPGLISLCHRGILFLDEMAEFKKQTLELLRQPLEDGKVTVSRMKGNIIYPAKFMLVGAMNPCPCGYYPDRNRCFCSATAIEKYLSKISGPILDRIDICVEASRLSPQELGSKNACEYTSRQMREIVEAAVLKQKERYKNESFDFNSEIPTSKIEQYIPLNEDCETFMYSMYTSLNLSMRSFYKIIRVARTIADISEDECVNVGHLAEAACYRFPDYLER